MFISPRSNFTAVATSIPRNLNSRSIKSRTWFFFVAIIGASLLVVSVFFGLVGSGKSAGGMIISPERGESIGDVTPPEHGSLISLEQVQLIWQEIISSPPPSVTR